LATTTSAEKGHLGEEKAFILVHQLDQHHRIVFGKKKEAKKEGGKRQKDRLTREATEFPRRD